VLASSGPCTYLARWRSPTASYHHTLGSEVGGLGPLAPAACQRLACDPAVTRVLVTPPAPPARSPRPGLCGPAGHGHPHDRDHPPSDPGLTGRLQAALAWLPPLLGGAPSQPLDLGRTSRVVTPAQRSALAGRDGGWVLPDCQRPAGLVGGPSAVALAGRRPPPTWRIWPYCAERIIGRSMRGLAAAPSTPTAGWPPSHRIGNAADDTGPPPEPAKSVRPLPLRASRPHGKPHGKTRAEPVGY
jgi:hypothetical protein